MKTYMQGTPKGYTFDSKQQFYPDAPPGTGGGLKPSKTGPPMPSKPSGPKGKSTVKKGK